MWPGVPGQPGWYRETMSQNKRQEDRENEFETAKRGGVHPQPQHLQGGKVQGQPQLHSSLDYMRLTVSNKMHTHVKLNM